MGETWDQLNTEFDSNGRARIMLPGTKVFIKQLVASPKYAYNTVKSNCTKNTDGGNGDKAAIVLWKERDEVEIVNYDYKIRNSVYLTVVHIYNKL